jgi:serine/threonine protein kinase
MFVELKGTFHGRSVAVKKLLSTIRHEDVFKSFLKEIEIMSSLKHENILEFFGACLEVIISKLRLSRNNSLFSLF